MLPVAQEVGEEEELDKLQPDRLPADGRVALAQAAQVVARQPDAEQRRERQQETKTTPPVNSLPTVGVKRK